MIGHSTTVVSVVGTPVDRSLSLRTVVWSHPPCCATHRFLLCSLITSALPVSWCNVHRFLFPYFVPREISARLACRSTFWCIPVSLLCANGLRGRGTRTSTWHTRARRANDASGVPRRGYCVCNSAFVYALDRKFAEFSNGVVVPSYVACV